MFNNCNVLIEKNKHRKFKNEIYNINHINVKKALLSCKNMRQTCRLILLNVFIDIEFELTQLFKKFYQVCSIFFKSLLSRFEQMIDKNKSSQILLNDADHKKSATFVRIFVQHCKFMIKVFI